jgi:hypothetical protein
MSDLGTEWTTFMTKLETAEEEFVKGRPASFQALCLVPTTLLFVVGLAELNADGKMSRLG